jgi:hypothetical protein
MAKPSASKTKPEIVHTVTIEEIHMIPGNVDEETGNPKCVVTVRAKSTDPEQKLVIVPVDMQAYVDSLASQYVDYINDFFAEAFGDAIGVDPATITGDFISQTP